MQMAGNGLTGLAQSDRRGFNPKILINGIISGMVGGGGVAGTS